MQTLLRTSRQDVRQLLAKAESLQLSRGAVQRLRWFLFALDHRRNVSLTCRHFGIARSTFLRWARRFDARRPETLEEESRRPHTVRQPEQDAAVIALVRQYREQERHLGKDAIRALLAERHGVTVSSSTVGRIIAREGLYFADTRSHRQKRRAFLLSREEAPADATTARSAQTPAHLPSAEDEATGLDPDFPFPVFGS